MSALDPIVKKVLNNIRAQGKYITKALAYLIAETLMNPNTGRFYSEDPIDAPIADTMTANCIDIISNSADDINFKTMKLQISSCCVM